MGKAFWIALVIGILFLLVGSVDKPESTLIGFGAFMVFVAIYIAMKRNKKKGKTGHNASHQSAPKVVNKKNEKTWIVAAPTAMKDNCRDFFSGEKLVFSLSQFYRFSLILQKIRLDRMHLTLDVAYDPMETPEKNMTISSYQDGNYRHSDVTEKVTFTRTYYFGENIVCKLSDNMIGNYDLLTEIVTVNTFSVRRDPDEIIGKISSSSFSTLSFLNNVQTKLEALHYAGSLQRAATFCLCDVTGQLEKYAKVVACDVRKMRLDSIKMEKPQQAVVEAELRLLVWTGRGMEEKTEKVRVEMAKITNSHFQAVNDDIVFDCPRCHHPISLLKGDTCQNCGTQTYLKMYDWCILNYESDLAGTSEAAADALEAVEIERTPKPEKKQRIVHHRRSRRSGSGIKTLGVAAGAAAIGAAALGPQAFGQLQNETDELLGNEPDEAVDEETAEAIEPKDEYEEMYDDTSTSGTYDDSSDDAFDDDDFDDDDFDNAFSGDNGSDNSGGSWFGGSDDSGDSGSNWFGDDD